MGMSRTDTTADRAAAAPAAVTKAVLFVDVVASTEFVRSHGDHEWRTAVHHHTRAVRAISTRRGGMVASFTGDGFLVLFDHPAGAVESALCIQRANAVQGLFDVRIGIDHGDILPFDDGWYVGMTLHVASRLTDLCGPGEVVMSDRCHRTARERVAIPAVERSERSIRGLDRPLTVCVVRRDHAA